MGRRLQMITPGDFDSDSGVHLHSPLDSDPGSAFLTTSLIAAANFNTAAAASLVGTSCLHHSLGTPSQGPAAPSGAGTTIFLRPTNSIRITINSIRITINSHPNPYTTFTFGSGSSECCVHMWSNSCLVRCFSPLRGA
ncbi:hypothetical protein M422DRAFT_32954 [Sphaerobolus stellatus SS14]|uniref:Uncharacterized protein n=1 Tax=Sphaerobolus stellatus (strain SS14) TaxID=990650 RepID=A0A0C9UVL4_SPHS4|nr:hypothetical protein M422DRAFT_32954 [Sphaerobolus stellatus SS14]